jgi:hypothetical protein
MHNSHVWRKMHNGIQKNPQFLGDKEMSSQAIVKHLESEWIPHSGGGCPISWAKAGEYDIAFRNGDIHLDSKFPPKDWRWVATNTSMDIVAWRLTDGWIPALGGKIPKEIEGAKAGEWEWRRGDGRIFQANYRAEQTYSNGWGIEIVAVRLVKRSQQQVEPTLHDVLVAAGFGSGGKYGEAAQQRLTREAYERYKARFPKVSPFRPLGETGIDECAALACKDHKL